jgi:hypothetical protein
MVKVLQPFLSTTIKSKDLFGQMKDMAAATIGFTQLGHKYQI